jgi:hypothetical protein
MARTFVFWLPELKELGLKLGLEVGAVKPWGTTGAKTFESERRMWDRFQSLGGEIYAVAMDEPLVAVLHDLHESTEYAVEQTAQFILLVRQHYPSVLIGDIEPYPAFSAVQRLQFIDALQARLRQLHVRGLDFFRLGAPDVYVIESWVGAPAQTIPETAEWSFTRSVLDFTRRVTESGKREQK